MISSLINLNLRKRVAPKPLKNKNIKNEEIYGRSEILETNDKFKKIPRKDKYGCHDF
jgi:hypothetical protein